MKQVDFPPLWKALAHPKRRRIIQLLHEKSRTTSEIAAHFDVSRFAIMQHLKVLERAELIETRREGRHRWNNLNEDLFQQIQEDYLENSQGAQYQLADILTFLARQEGAQSGEKIDPEPAFIKLQVTLQAPANRVYQAITRDIDEWWSNRITVDSHMHLEPQVGGRFFEEFNGGGGVLYASVTYLKQGEEIRLTGAMDLVEEAWTNSIHLVLTSPQPDVTQLLLSHHFLGKVNVITVDSYKQSWEKLLKQHLKIFVESGTRFDGTDPH